MIIPQLLRVYAMDSLVKLYIILGIIVLNNSIFSKGFTAYWNIPLEACTRNGIHFNLSKYDIVFNTGFTFNGDKVNKH